MRLVARWLAPLILCLSVAAQAETFTVSDIRLQGLQRVSAGTVFNIMPINVGDSLDEVSIRQLVRLLFRSGYFKDIRMSRDGSILVITLVERPAIESIEIEGNKAIKTEALLEGLGQHGGLGTGRSRPRRQKIDAPAPIGSHGSGRPHLQATGPGD